MKPGNFEALKEIGREMYASEESMHSIGETLTAQLFPGLQSAAHKGIKGAYFRANKQDGKPVEFWFQFCYCGTWDEPVTEFEQLLPVLEVLKKIKTQNVAIESFYLTISTYIKNGTLKEWLKGKVNEILGNQIIEAFVFDLKDYLDFLFEQVDGELRDNILDANQRFFEEFQERMEQQFYFPEVPFNESKNRLKSNPTRFLDEVLKIQFAEMAELLYALRQEGRQTATQPSRQKCFIVSEFGFGKTTLLLHYAQHLKTQNIIPIYIPMSLLDNTAFKSVSDLIRNILGLITGTRVDAEKEYFDKLRIRVFKEMMKIRTDIVLLFDGLDEHTEPYKSEGLQQIAYTLKDFKPPCVFSVRKEFWDARRERFEDAFISKRRPFEKIELLEWTDDAILEYLKQYAERTQTTVQLSKFIELVAGNNYEQYYGDIPKRPLFLEMLVRDVLSGEVVNRNLSQLYESYFLEKFKLGRETFYKKRTGRPLPVQDAGAEVVVGKMLRVMERAAAEMLSNDEEGNIEFLNQVVVSRIERFLKESDIQDDLAFFLHSVLIPFDNHSFAGLKVKFAHKSFQEYFVARYFTRLLLDPGSGGSMEYDWLTRYNVTDGVPKFMIGILETLDSADKDAYKVMLDSLFLEKAPVNSVIKRLQGSSF